MIDLSKKFDLDKVPRYKKILLILAGYFFVIMGVLGIFLPVMPTTIFFILAAASFLRSSRKNYDRLMNNKIIGRYLRNYIEQKGMSVRSKFMSIALLWLTLLLSIFVFVDILWVRILLFGIGAGVTIHISKLKTLHEPNAQKIESEKEKIAFSESEGAS